MSLYKKVPIVLSDGICPVCKRRLSQLKSTEIIVYKKNKYKTAKERLIYCPNCDICYVNKQISEKIKKDNNGYVVYQFKVKENANQAYLKKIINTSYLNDNTKKYYYTYRGQPIQNDNVVHNNIKIKENKTQAIISRKIIYIVNEFGSKCNICSENTYNGSLPIYNENHILTDINCKKCKNHIIIEQNDRYIQLLSSNQNINQYKLNYDFFFQDYKKVNHYFNSQEKVYFMFLMKEKQGDVFGNELTVIVSDKKFNVSERIVVVDYKNEFVKKLITDVKRDGKKEVCYCGKNYYVCVFKESETIDLCPKKLIIKKGGGIPYGSEDIGEPVILYLFSPYTQKYEVIHATYDNENQECFIDIRLFREFVAKYGNPGIKLFPPDTKNFIDLNEESLLRCYGYNVNQTDNLSDNKRQEILREVIDLKIMNPYSIICLLRGCYSRAKGNRHLYACEKYERDIEFVQNYKFNPQRFLIADFLKENN